MRRFEYRTVTVRITGASSGVFSAFLSKGVRDDDQQALVDLGSRGWDLVGVVPVSHGAVGASSTDAAICFLKREIPEVERGATSGPQDARASDVRRMVLRRQIVRLAASPAAARIDDATWATVVEGGVPEALPIIEAQPALLVEKAELMARYFATIEKDQAAACLYRIIESQPQNVSAPAIEIIRNLGLVRYDALASLLTNADSRTRTIPLVLAKTEKSEYSVEDIALLDKLRRDLHCAFTEAPIHTKRGLLGAKHVWTCPQCRHEYAADTERSCPHCQVTRRGLPVSIDFDAAVASLRDRAEALRECFKISGDAAPGTANGE